MKNKHTQADKNSEILDNWHKIGTAFFKDKACPEIGITTELQKITVCSSVTCAEGELVIFGTTDDGEVTGNITFLPEIDRNDAFRLAGLLMAWGDSERIHAATGKGE